MGTNAGSPALDGWSNARSVASLRFPRRKRGRIAAWVRAWAAHRPPGYNFRTVAIPSDLARTTIEIAHWILDQNDTDIPITSIEYIDLVEQRVHKTRKRRVQTIRRLKTNARGIRALWDAA